MDHYPNFEKLSHSEAREGYRIRWRLGTSGIAVLSIHGGEIEPGTTRIANAIAGQEHSFYSFEGTLISRNRRLHITSTRLDEPTAMEIVCQSEIIISIHGSADLEPIALLGGLDVELTKVIRHELRKAGFEAEDTGQQSDSRWGLRFGGTDQKNICNLCGRGMGVQIEISRGLRATMFRDLSPEGRLYPTTAFSTFADAVRKALEPFAAAYIQRNPVANTD